MYRNSLRALFVPVLLLMGLRTLLKVLAIDTVTGFYNGAPLPGALFTGIFLLSAALIVWYALREPDTGMSALRGNRSLEIAGAMLGLVLIAVSAVRLYALLTSPSGEEVNVLPRGLRDLEHLLGIGSGGVLLWLAASSVSGAERSEKNGCAALIIVLWQALFLIDRFISFRQAATVSDQLLETLFLLSALLFWLAHSRCMADCQPSRRRVMLFGMLAILLGIPLAFAQAAALAILGEVSGPGAGDIALISLSCVYFAAFLDAARRSPSVQADAKSETEE